jgi:hypothetical protein
MRLVSAIKHNQTFNEHRASLYLEKDQTHDDTDWERCFDELAVKGGIYPFRPWKVRRLKNATGKDKFIRVMMPLCAALPVILGFVAGFFVHWKSDPEGFGCRHIWILGVFAIWIISMVITSVIHRKVEPLTHWRIVFVKDALIGLGVMIIVFLSVAGAFNSCVCWGLTRRIYPITKPLLEEHKAITFPAISGVCIFLQLLYVVFIICCMRRAWLVRQWGEKVKRNEWRQIHGLQSADPLHIFLRS